MNTITSQLISHPSLLHLVKQAVHEIEPDARIILYGSRSRGDATPESDWDFLILVEGLVTELRKDAIRHRLYDIEWEHGEVLSAIICGREDWDSRRYRATPFHQHVDREGFPL